MDSVKMVYRDEDSIFGQIYEYNKHLFLDFLMKILNFEEIEENVYLKKTALNNKELILLECYYACYEDLIKCS